MLQQLYSLHLHLMTIYLLKHTAFNGVMGVTATSTFNDYIFAEAYSF